MLESVVGPSGLLCALALCASAATDSACELHLCGKSKESGCTLSTTLFTDQEWAATETCMMTSSFVPTEHALMARAH